LLELAPDLEAALNTGHTLVVPTAQRAAAVRLAFAGAQLTQGHRAFRTPDIQSLSGWLRGQPAGSGTDGPTLRRLGASEEWLLWRAAVAAAAAELAVPAAGLVDAVRQSAALLYEWHIPPAALQESGTAEALLLARTLTLLESRLAELGAAGSWRTLHDLSHEPPRRAPLFTGFAMQTPARRALLAAWEARGTPVRELPCAFAGVPGSLAQAEDPSTELAMIAHWCRERLSALPTARLLVVVPDLARRQSEVRRAFDEALDPLYLQRATGIAHLSAYAVEGGRPLISHEPVAEGVRTLQVLSAEVDLAEISQWLRGNFWLRPDASRRALLDVWLRTVVPPRLDAGQLLAALRAAPPALLAQADEVATHLERMREALAAGSPASLAGWSARFARVLTLCGLDCGAARQRDSHAQQVLQRLEELLQECAALPAALGVIDAGEALSLFTQLLTRTQFEPATGDTPVTLTATLADPIVRYDGVWVSGLHAGVIPQGVRFDPFIPASLQRRAGVPAADAAAQVACSERALADLGRCSREFILSAPAHAADLELGFAPLLEPYTARPYAPAQRGVGLARAIRATRAVERIIDETGLRWPHAVPLPAGTRAIELQSRCPFRAYAQLRLGAEPLEAPVPGITPRERGKMLHRALHLLWLRLKDSAGLNAARVARTLAQIIRECVAQAATEILEESDRGHSDATGLLALREAAIIREQGRACRLLNTLCEIEAARAPFAIHEVEADHRLELAGALINVRIDRIDRLADGSHAILDYKSGRAVTPDWEVERTTHPQLLVYLLAAGVPVSTLAVAHLDPKAVLLKGIGDEDGRLPGIKGVAAGAWPQQLDVWRDQVATLAADFVAGDARVDPMDKACDHCHLHAFCRIADRDRPP